MKAFNPLARPDRQPFAVLNGEHVVRGFTNSDLREKLAASAFSIQDDPKSGSSQVSRLLHRLHVHGLIAKIPRSRRWRVTAFGYYGEPRIMPSRFRNSADPGRVLRWDAA